MITDAMETLNSITGGRLSLGKTIKSIRLCDGFKQGEFAKLLGVTQSYLSDLEHDRKEVSAQKSAEFAKTLGQSEKQFIRLALQDALVRQGFKYQVDIHDIAVNSYR